MLAFGLSIAAFAFWGVVGYAVLAVLRIRRNSIQNMLLAPVVGLSATLLPVFWLSRAGLPVAHFGVPLTAVLFLVSVGTIWRFRPVFPLRQYWPFAGVLLLALFLTGRPMLEFGFNWLSYSNDDMANYVLGAVRILNHGFFDIPSAEQLAMGRDYSLTYWFFNLGVRSGSEMLTSWVSSVTALMTDRIFMPLMLALHLVLISTAGALVNQSRSFRLPALLTCVVLSFSALTSLGTLYQLISQVGGVALLAGCTLLVLSPRLFSEMRGWAALRHSLLVSLLISALFVMYPEVSPFLILSFGLYALIGLVRRRLSLRPLLISLGPAALISLIFLNSYAFTAMLFLRDQASAGLSPANTQTALFPYYLIPSGLANLWGLQSITGLSPEPWLSVSILFGALLLLAAVGAVGWQSWRLAPSATMALVMLGLGIRLFAQRSDFGLFKLAMFIQPFILGTMVMAWFGLIERPLWRILPFLLLASFGLQTQAYYVERSRGQLNGVGSGLVEVPWASVGRINDEFRNLITATNPTIVVADTSNIVLAKFQALYLKGIESTFPAKDMFYNVGGADPGFQLFNPGIPVAAQALRDARGMRFLSAQFELNDPSHPGATNAFVIDDLQPPTTASDETQLIASTRRQTIVNGWKVNASENYNSYAEPWNQVLNHLIFISSQLGQPYYTADRLHVSLNQLEPDLFFTGDTMAGIGRYFLFQVINPTHDVRLVVEMTATLKGDGENQLPPAVAIGAGRWSFPMLGRGSARVFSPPLTPQLILGRPYLGIDMGIDGKRFPDHRSGLMNLYGTDVLLDIRRLVGFGRDISLVSAEDYASLAPPSQVDTFPSDLTNPDLEYSGLYEDGWVAEAAFLKLTQPNTTAQLTIRGSVPLLSDPSFSTEIRVLVDGQEVTRKMLAPGAFELRLKVPPGAGQRRIDLRFSATQKLPSPDNRPAAALLQFVGFER